MNMTKHQERSTGNIMTGGYRADECFALTVTDDGFLPSIMPNDIVIIHKQPDVENGELAAVMIDHDTNAVLRRIWRDETGGMTLTVNNACGKQYEPIVIDCDELYRVHCFGKVISLVRDITQFKDEQWVNNEILRRNNEFCKV